MRKHSLLIMAFLMLFGFGVRAQSNCEVPTGLTASVHNPQWENVLLSWDMIADSTMEDIMWSTTVYETRIGTNSAADFIGTVRFTPTDIAAYAGRYLTSVTFVPGEAQSVCTYSIVVWQGGSQIDDTTFNAGNMVVNQEITTPLTANTLNTVMLDTALLIDVSQELWIGIRCNTTAGYPLGASQNPQVTGKGELLYIGGNWVTLSASDLTTHNWLIIGHLQDPTYMLSGYNIYRDDNLIATVGSTNYVDTLEEGTYQYALTANYINGCESDPITVSVTMDEYPCANCQDTVIVGNGTTGTYSIPLNTFYKYSFSEQIYTADELSDISGRINCISFQYIYSSNQTKDIVVYMGNTSKSAFANSSDWIPVSQMTPVYQGAVTFSNSGEDNWVNIPFDVPFEYDGGSNIVVAVLNLTGAYTSSTNNTFNVHTASGKTLYMQNDSSPYDVNALSSGSTSSNRNNIRFLIGDPILCPAPSMLTISNVSAESATASWHSNDAHTSYELVLVPEGESIEDQISVTASDTFYVFENLTDNTTYNVYLRALCGGDNSSWCFPATFTTDPYCTSPENLTVSQIAGTSALVSWEPAAVGATSYTVAYTEAGQENWITQPATEYQYILSDLSPMTAYQVAVTSVCELGNAPAVVKTFTTRCLAGGESTIGEGTSTSTSIPSYSFYKHGYSQQIFTSSEIGGATNITSIAMNMSNLSQQRNYKIYLAHTTATSLSSGWASTTGAQLVFDSPQTLTTGWNTFEFATPFAYNGNDNLLLIVIDSNSNYVSGNAWYTHSAFTGSARYMYTDNAAYPLEPTSSTSGTALNVRNNVRFGGNCDETVTCIAPNVFLSNITSESLTVTWAPGNGETSWEMEYCSDTANWISEGVVTTSPHIITGLDANTIYFVRMRSVCGGDYSNYTTQQFRTECDEIANLPYVENFDAYSTGTNAYPTCWSKINTYTSEMPYISTTHYSGVGSLYFYAGTSGSYNIAVMPPISASINVNTLSATFMYKASNTSDMLIVGVMTDPAHVNTFVAVDTIYPESTPSDWSERTVYFNQYTGNGQYIAFKNEYFTTYAYAYIDDLSVEVMSSCPKPSQLTAVSTLSDTVILSWQDDFGSAWNIIYGPIGFDPDTSTETTLIQGITDNPYYVSGLEAGVGYDFYVQSDCGDDVSNWCTYPAAGYAYTYTMGLTGSDTVYGCGMTITDNGGPSGNYANSCHYTLVVYPSDPDSIVSISGTFVGEGTVDYLSVYNGDGVDENELIQKIVSGSSGTVINFGPMISEVGPLTLLFHTDGSVVYSGFVASVTCLERPSCPRPTHLSAIDATSSSVTLEWTPSGNESSWNIEYGPLGFEHGNGTTVVATSNPFTVDNLDNSSSYDFYVQANCDGGEVSDWSSKQTASTTMVATSLPYQTDFTTDQSWMMNNGAAPSYWMMGTPSGATQSALFVTSDGSSAGYNSSSPAVSMAEKLFTMPADDSVHVQFDVEVGGESSFDYLKVFLAPATEEFTPSATSSNTQSSYTYSTYAFNFNSYLSQTGYTSYPYKLNLTQGNAIHIDMNVANPDPNGSAKIVFLWRNDNSVGTQPGAIIRNFSISEVGSGPVVTNPTVTTGNATAIGQTSATLNATITNPDNVTITAKGFEWKTTTGGTYTQVAGTGTGNTFTANLTGLTASTGYTYKAFITYNGQTVYGSENTFTTQSGGGPEACDVPTNITTSNITKESITVAWDNSDASSWNVQYRPQNGTLSSASTTTNSYQINGLTPLTTYEIQVQAVCANGQTSEWSAIVTATTLPDGIENHLDKSVTLYPNPAKEYVDIRIDGDVYVTLMEVIDVYGKVIRTVETMCTSSLQTMQINVSGLADGMYFVRVTTDAGVVTKPFVKK